MAFYTCFDWFKKLRLFANERNLKIDVVLKAKIGKYKIYFHSLRNRAEKFAKVSLFYTFLLKLVQINFIFSQLINMNQVPENITAYKLILESHGILYVSWLV
jgi:hypothetical protein